MSEQEGFLSRWSRLKREAEEGAPNAETPAPAAAEPAPREQGAASSQPSEPEGAPADLSALPPIESITAATDIRAFLAAGVPSHLTRAALRRAWLADPAIRDFVGLAENAWDFTAPDAMAGFGPLSPTEAQRLLAKVEEHMQQRSAAAPAADSEPLQKPHLSAPREAAPRPDAPEEAPAAQATQDHPAGRPADVAVQKQTTPDEGGKQPVRRHGGALPYSTEDIG